MDETGRLLPYCKRVMLSTVLVISNIITFTDCDHDQVMASGLLLLYKPTTVLLRHIPGDLIENLLIVN
jgi:hypothetical protein